MKVLVLGASGMLGHKVLQVLSQRFETYGTTRSRVDVLHQVAPQAAAILEPFVATDFDSITRVVTRVRPDVIVNCIGIIKQVDAAKHPIATIRLNSLFPHQLADVCRTAGVRLVHISTDCVFSGAKGSYVEADIPDPTDLYGRSKLLGEVSESPALTLRTSIVGRELRSANGLVEWFLSQRGGTVQGFRRAIFSGWSTASFARALGDVIDEHRGLSGIWHVASSPITKFDLLELLRDAFAADVAIEPDDGFACDRSLDGSAFRAATGITAPEWPEMVQEMRRESTFYDALREPSVAGR